MPRPWLGKRHQWRGSSPENRRNERAQRMDASSAAAAAQRRITFDRNRRATSPPGLDGKTTCGERPPPKGWAGRSDLSAKIRAAPRFTQAPGAALSRRIGGSVPRGGTFRLPPVGTASEGYFFLAAFFLVAFRLGAFFLAVFFFFAAFRLATVRPPLKGQWQGRLDVRPDDVRYKRSSPKRETQKHILGHRVAGTPPCCNWRQPLPRRAPSMCFLELLVEYL